MNILVDIAHPAQVHLFKHFVRLAEEQGHRVVIYARDKDCTLDLLQAERLEYAGWTSARGGAFWNLVELIVRDWQVWRLARKNRIDIALGTSVAIAHVAAFTRMKAFVFNENDVETVMPLARLAYPFCTGVVAPTCVRMGKWEYKRIPYNGYQKLAYLHPHQFQADPDICRRFGLDPDAPYYILRLTSFEAYHDKGQAGLSRARVRRLVDLLSAHGRVLISSEHALASEFSAYRLPVPPQHIHHVMAFAAMLVGDSQSMVTESALLGVPAFYCSTFAGRFSVGNELDQKYGLAFSFIPDRFDEMVARIEALLARPDVRGEWQEKRNSLLADKVDVTQWILSFAERQV